MDNLSPHHSGSTAIKLKASALFFPYVVERNIVVGVRSKRKVHETLIPKYAQENKPGQPKCANVIEEVT